MASPKSTIIILLFAIFCLLSHVSAKTPIGAVKVVILNGEELTDKDPGADLSDPYVKLWVDGNPKQKSTVKKNTLFPFYDETFVFPLYSGSRKLHIEVWDKDSGRNKDDLMGRAVISLDSLCKPSAAEPVCTVDGAFAEFDNSHFNYLRFDFTRF
ncbi:9341_t:CDS:2 [Paraglomus brasilianum]|uniref:9341_t:CDS:1 n=1 Tax=Paraglomus brasilianum TaxID=144538 RepID=A0A9N8ZQD2_9GLOM|nr:9341_t:CDS:2 [Paraglomus brasilianum]